MHFLLLPAILWSPLEQYSDVITRECPKCKDEGVNSVLYATGWTDGSSTEQPRLIHCVNSNVILISRIYITLRASASQEYLCSKLRNYWSVIVRACFIALRKSICKYVQPRPLVITWNFQVLTMRPLRFGKDLRLVIQFKHVFYTIFGWEKVPTAI